MCIYMYIYIYIYTSARYVQHSVQGRQQTYYKLINTKLIKLI